MLVKVPSIVAKFAKKVLRNAAWYLRSLWASGFSRLGLSGTVDVRVAKSMLTRVIFLASGASLLALGIMLTIFSGVGVGPADVFITGIANISGLSIGVASYSYLAVVLLGLLLVRRRPSIGGVSLAAIVSSWFFVLPSLIPQPESTLGSWFFLSGGLLLMVGGIEMATAAGFGRGNTEILVEEISDRFSSSERTIRTIFEFTLLGAGIALGGQLGWGTVVVAVLIGPLLQAFAQFVNDFQVGRQFRLEQQQAKLDD